MHGLYAVNAFKLTLEKHFHHEKLLCGERERKNRGSQTEFKKIIVQK